ncbi:hypothetical protein LEP1GSC193_3872 [Leptospira alstonii serovar Pingchang str. 80-412]|uniref:Uncharacterized protein n=1 Tax=Leptospira alstonii serovar Pingchang str. 80-412 TaxID=1218564 RepID=T0HEW4_9LEPT|nr:hypothetical protein LEP1GSC193_3872 [Leptospira alstonii serovar Pingchang str. 80-412]
MMKKYREISSIPTIQTPKVLRLDVFPTRVGPNGIFQSFLSEVQNTDKIGKILT